LVSNAVSLKLAKPASSRAFSLGGPVVNGWYSDYRAVLSTPGSWKEVCCKLVHLMHLDAALGKHDLTYRARG